MANLNVAMIAPNDFSKELGKKGTTSDISLYDLKQGSDTITFIEPTKYPERLAPLFYAVSLSDQAIVVVDAINPQLGECIVMLQCAGVKRGYFILHNFITPEQLAPLIKGTVLEGYRVIDENFPVIRQMLIDEAKDTQREALDEPGAVAVDHFFNVKGVGTVVLGYVTYGKVHLHDDLKVLPLGKVTQVRSIQKHDDDFDEAGPGDRVGLALKNIEATEFDRGFVLTKDQAIKADSTITGSASIVKFWKLPIKEGMVIHIGHWMQFITTRVTNVEEGEDAQHPIITLTLEQKIIHRAGSKAVLMYLDGGKLRVIGTMTLP